MHKSTLVKLKQKEPKVSEQLRFIIKTGSAISQWLRQAAKTRNRLYRLKQLVKTEEEYRRDLIKIRDGIKNKLVSAQIITREQSNVMFPNLDGMISLSEQIHEEFQTILATWTPKQTCIGSKMKKYAHPLLIYNQYLKNLLETQSKFKAMVEEKEEVRRIQKQLSTQNRIVTFSDLLVKPFQRPLKYHLLLRDYWLKMETHHPDYFELDKAIAEFETVNQKNNQSVQHHQKNQKLVELDSIFGNIIQEQSRQFINKFEAKYLGYEVVIYLLSDLVVLAHVQEREKEVLRIKLYKHSHVQAAGNTKLFKNRLYIYGKRICVHLTFMSKILRDQAYRGIQDRIRDISLNETSRNLAIQERLSENMSPRKLRKNSMMELEPQIERPIVVHVIGMENRELVAGQQKRYYVVEFYPIKINFDDAYTPHHTSLLEEQTLQKLENIMLRLYPNQIESPSINSIFNNLVHLIQYQNDEVRRFDMKTVLIQLFLNSLFRSEQILKRIDFVMHLLKISDAVWNFIKGGEEQCSCRLCVGGEKIATAEGYFKEIEEREGNLVRMRAKGRKAYYCDRRTIQAHRQFASLFPELLSKAVSEERIAWCKRKLGKFNHKLGTARPRSEFATTTIRVILRCFPKMKQVQIKCLIGHRVQAILRLLQLQLHLNLQDYALVAEVNRKAVVLNDDELIGNFLKKIERESDAFSFGRVFNWCCQSVEHNPKNIQFFLEKYWVVYCPNDYLQLNEGRVRKIDFQIEAFMARLVISEEVIATLDQTFQFYALFLCWKYFERYEDFNEKTVEGKLRSGSEIYFPPKFQSKGSVDAIYRQIDRIKKEELFREKIDLSLAILIKASRMPGWSCCMYPAVLEIGTSQPMSVKVGCDMYGLKVREKGGNGSGVTLEFRIEEEGWSSHMSGFTLILTEGERVFNIKGNQMWKVGEQIKFYKLYSDSFRFE